jgi:hypothetical protein
MKLLNKITILKNKISAEILFYSFLGGRILKKTCLPREREREEENSSG